MSPYLPLLAGVAGVALGAVIVWLALRPQAQAVAEHAAAKVRSEAEAHAAKLREELIRREGAEAAMIEKLKGLDETIEVLAQEKKSAEAIIAAERQLRSDAEGEIKRLTALHGAAGNDCTRLEAELAKLREHHVATTTELRTKLEQEQAARQAAERGLAELRSRDAERDKGFAEKAKLLEDAQAALKDVFAKVAQDQLSTSNTSFLQLADTQLKPIGELLGRFDKTVQEIETKRAEAYGGISTELRALREAQAQLHGKATELTDALRGTPTRWGRWGELQLRNLVEMSGMMSYCDFFEQETVTGADGAKLRPDMLIRLAGGRHIAVDSKAPVELYLTALEQPTEEERLSKLRDYAAGVRRHVADLTRKSYWEHVAGSPEFVVMFMPGESFFSAVHIADPSLIEPTAETRVILASPTTLLALLRAVAYGWKQVQLADNARQISDAGAELYKRVRVFLEHMQKVGKGLSSAMEGYNAATGSLDSRVLPAARKMHELGASDGKLLPDIAALEIQPRQLTAPELFADAGRGNGMPPLKTVQEVIDMLHKDGWFRIKSKGGHRQYNHPVKPGKVTVSGKPSDNVAAGTLASIYKQAGWK